MNSPMPIRMVRLNGRPEDSTTIPIIQRVHEALLSVAYEGLCSLERDLETAPFQSPIEQAFLMAICGLCTLQGKPHVIVKVGDSPAASGVLYVQPQAPIGPFFADFLVWMGAEKIVVECDGDEFHARTQGQASRDRSRDRYMQDHGFKVYRFTGRELFTNAVTCAEQVLQVVEQS